jgi:hypothetical protein
MDSYKFLPLLGRILLGAPFLMSGLSKLGAYAATVGYISAVGLPAPSLAYIAAVAIEVGRGVLPPQLLRSEPDDPLPEERDDGRRSPADHLLRCRRVQSGCALHGIDSAQGDPKCVVSLACRCERASHRHSAISDRFTPVKNQRVGRPWVMGLWEWIQE